MIRGMIRYSINLFERSCFQKIRVTKENWKRNSFTTVKRNEIKTFKEIVDKRLNRNVKTKVFLLAE